MESHEQPLLLADDAHLNYDCNFGGFQSSVEVQFDDSGCPVTHESSTLERSELHESGTSEGNQQVELFGNVDNYSVLENGREPGHIEQVSATGNDVRGAVCIGSVVSVNEQANTGFTKQLTDAATRAHKIHVSPSHNRPENRIDYGASLAMEDFGGEFEDGHGIDEFASVNVFEDSAANKPDTINAPPVETDENSHSSQVQNAEVQDDAVNISPEEQLDVPASLDKILPKSPAGEVSLDEEPPTLEREVFSNAQNSEPNDGDEEDGDAAKSSSKLPSRRSQRHGEAANARKRASDSEELPASNLELNVNSRPRRSVNRKSVFELLHVDYRYAGGPKKVSTHRASDGEVNHERPSKKQRSSKKGTKVSDEHPVDSIERPVKTTPVKTTRLLPIRRDYIDDIDDQINALKRKVVGYTPDDFLDDDDDAEPESTKNTEGTDNKPAPDADSKTLKETIFAEMDDQAARSFLSTFAAESAEALSSSEQKGDIGNDLDTLTAENHQLRLRIKALEQSRVLTKKFNIDFHGRKFSRVRSAAIMSPDQQKTPGKIIGTVYDKTPAAEQKAPVEAGESMLSRIAVLDRREHKLRELSAELDERSTSVKIAEGALRRRERKLLDFEKTLEHRERVLSRHEQSVLKRELMLGSSALPVGDPALAEGEDRQSLAAEIQRRLEQRRLELDRRQAAMDSERTRLEVRERELDQRAASSRMAEKSTDDDDGDGSADPVDRSSSRPSKRLTSVGNQKRKTSVSHTIRAKYLSPKKQKVYWLDFNWLVCSNVGGK